MVHSLFQEQCSANSSIKETSDQNRLSSRDIKMKTPPANPGGIAALAALSCLSQEEWRSREQTAAGNQPASFHLAKSLTVVSPLLTQWRYHSLALSCQLHQATDRWSHDGHVHDWGRSSRIASQGRTATWWCWHLVLVFTLCRHTANEV